MYYTELDTQLGRVIIAAEDDGLTGLWFEGQQYFPDITGWERKNDYPIFVNVEKWLEIYFSGGQPELNFKLAPKGTAFQEQVWNELLKIPHGAYNTYGGIAKRLGSSPRAVGNAVGHNPISLIIPCHRVIGSNRSLTGYAGGLERKKKLIALEGITL